MTQRVFLTKSGTANFSCPECGEVRNMDVARFKNIQKEIRLRCTCKCKHVFSVVLERRTQVRRSVSLRGKVLLDKIEYPVTILDISRYGLKVKSIRKLDISTGDRVHIEFTLDDGPRSYVRNTMVVRSIREKMIGMEFVDHNHYGRLGAYMMAHFS